MPTPTSAPTVASIETAVRSVTAEALNLPDVAPEDNLLELGVDSLVATWILAELRTRLLVEIPLIDVFESVNVRAFAEHISDLIAEVEH
ncbi:phosphopantetheine-binding protein [Micromonospora sp. NPDC050980]|uniref:phosphopantetheine-binding protein n=1 Tax=Micromonospora sp. NPDC050980 TaxID=3155161 RepID=UPI003404C5A7